MKIYINNFNMDILSAIMEALNEYYYIKSETYIQIYGVDGIYKIDESSIKKLNCNDNDIKILKNYYNNFTLIVDTSYYTIETVNKIPSEHISNKIIKYFYKINKQSNLNLIIECSEKNSSNSITPTDIYFEIEESIDINNLLIKKEIIEFLSLLN